MFKVAAGRIRPPRQLKLCRKYCCLPISEKKYYYGFQKPLLRSTFPTQSKPEQKYLCI